MSQTHLLKNGKWVRQPGLIQFEIEAKFPVLKKFEPSSVSLEDFDKSYYIKAYYADFLPRLKYLLLNTDLNKKRLKMFKSYDLIDIYLSKSEEYDAVSGLYRLEMLVLFLGLAEPPNKYLPELVCQLIEGRKLEGMTTWVVSSTPVESLSMLYPSKLVNLLREFQLLLW